MVANSDSSKGGGSRTPAGEDAEEVELLELHEKESTRGPTRRRCPENVKYNCAKSSHRCNVFVGNFGLLEEAAKSNHRQHAQHDLEASDSRSSTSRGTEEQASSKQPKKGKKGGGNGGGSCPAFGATCGAEAFCGLSGVEANSLAATFSGMSATNCCWFRMHGSGGTPKWYKYKDYRNSHKCIDKEMKDAMACPGNGKKRATAKTQAFIKRMDSCAQKHGASKFNDLVKDCADGAVLKKMKECKDQVRQEMLKERVECRDDCGEWVWPWSKANGPQNLKSSPGESGANPSASDCKKRAGKAWSGGEKSTEGMKWHEKIVHHFKRVGRKIKGLFR